MSNLAYRHAWNVGFSKRLESMLTEKKASAAGRALMRRPFMGHMRPGAHPLAEPQTLARTVPQLPGGLKSVGRGSGVTLNGPKPAQLGYGAGPARDQGTTWGQAAANTLWNNRTPWQRAGIGAGIAQLGSMHSQARGAQNAYDAFSEQHPVLATLARLGGVRRPGYFEALPNPLNPLGLF